MDNLGEFLKNCRCRLGLSQKAVEEKTGITDSRLSKIENGQRDCPGKELRQLAVVYGIPVIPLFLEAGFLTPEDLTAYQCVFQGAEKLNEEERRHIQESIDLFVGKKETAL